MLTRLALVAVVLVGCEGSQTSDRDEALTCDVGGAGALANACVKASAPQPFFAKPLATAWQDTPGVFPNWIAYGVHLVSVNGTYEGAISFTAPESATYEIYLGTPNVPFTLRARDGTPLSAGCTSSIASTECAYLRKVRSYALTQGQDVRIEIGPTTVSYVRLYIQSKQVTPPTCVADELTEETAACTAASEGATPLTAAVLPTAGLSPDIAADTVYGVRLPATSTGGYGGQIEFRPPSDGTYELYLGTPNIPLRIIADNVWTTPATECTRYIPSTECSLLRRGTRLALRADTTYRFEFGPGSNTYVRVELRTVAAPSGAVKLAAPQVYPADNASQYLSAGDLDSDGALDLAVSCPDDAGGATFVDVLRNNGAGAFAKVAAVFTSAPAETVVSDFNHDGIGDIAGLAWDGQGALPAFYLQGQGNFMYAVSTWGNSLDFQQRLSAGDFDEDGALDLVAAWTDSQFGSGTGGFVITKMPAKTTLQNDPAFADDTRQAIAGDFNGDGHQDVIAASASTSALKLYLGNGSGTVSFLTDVTLPGGGITYIAAFDLDKDGRSDVVALHSDGTFTVSHGTALGLSAAATYAGSGRSVTAGDFDHDGRTDLAFASSPIAIYLATDAGFVRAAELTAPTGVGSSIVARDFDGDGFDDLVVPGQSSVEVWLSTP